jgi:hypothetical protein
VSKRKGSPYRSGRSPDWLKMKNSNAPAVTREAEEDWGKEQWRCKPRSINSDISESGRRSRLPTA